jgi:hypothetical protein
VSRTLYDQHFERISCSPPFEHRTFKQDNADGRQLSDKLIVRGVQVTKFYAQANHIWEKRRFLKDRRCWHVQSGIGITDAVVHIANFSSMGHRGMTIPVYNLSKERDRVHGSDGLWLLRPVENDQHVLVACLSWLPADDHQLYDQGVWDTDADTSALTEDASKHHRLAVDPLLGVRWDSDYDLDREEGSGHEYRKFIIT